MDSSLVKGTYFMPVYRLVIKCVSFTKENNLRYVVTVQVHVISYQSIRKEERNNIPPLQSAPVMYHTRQFMSRPEPLLSFSDYAEDIKARVQVHNYEWNKLMEDLNNLRKVVSTKVSQFTDSSYFDAIDM